MDLPFFSIHGCKGTNKLRIKNYDLRKNVYLCTQNMMLELHNVTIGQQIHSLSLTVNDG